MRVLLLSINRLRFPYPVYPIGLDYVAAALAPAHEVRLLDLCPLEDGEVGPAIDSAVREFQPGAVGISIRNIDNLDRVRLQPFVSEMRAVVDRVRAATSAPVVLGGAGYTLYAAELLDALGADHGVVGEGEHARALFDALEAASGAAHLPGVASRGAPAPPPAMGPPGTSPLRASPAVNPALGWYLRKGGILGVQTQRGCAFRCSYCTYPAIEGGTLRTFEPAGVAAEARRLEELGAKFLCITDGVFNGDPGHALAVAEAFRRTGLSLPWGAFFAPLRPPPGFYEAMARAGCTHVEFGTESLSDAMLPRLRKPFRRAHVLEAHAAARAAGLNLAHFLLLGGPGETPGTVDETLDAAEALSGAALFFFCGIRIHAGTEMEALARSTGQIATGQSLLEPVFYEPTAISLAAIAERVARRGAGRPEWITGSGADAAAALVARLHARGEAGPLWEKLVLA